MSFDVSISHNCKKSSRLLQKSREELKKAESKGFGCFFLRQKKVQQNSYQCSGYNAGTTKHQAHRFGQLCQNGCICAQAIAKAKSHRHNGHIAASERLFGDELNAAHNNGGEHDYSGTAQNALGHDGQNSRELGEQTTQHKEDATAGEGAAVDNPGHGNKAHVLAEGGVGQHAEQRSKRGSETITHNAARKLPVGGFAAHAALGNAGNIAYGFHSGNNEHDDHWNDCTRIKYRLNRHEAWNGKPVGIGNLIPVEHPCLGIFHALGGNTGGGKEKGQNSAQRITTQNAHKDAGGAQDSLAAVLDKQDHYHYKQCD
ncbi:hypothetical protein EVA_09474 [gut metagenome]|uniref:Uncharacterized protein n=1 Tax=gut metagenome TaxID=749906 RepID=J9CQJ9_9ZZZZ